MRIGFVGNTNNYPFILAITFRRMGHEVEFIVDRKERLNRPCRALRSVAPWRNFPERYGALHGLMQALTWGMFGQGKYRLGLHIVCLSSYKIQA